MRNEKKYLIEEFEKEFFLFFESSLPPDRMEFWDNKIEEDEDLRRIYDENLKVFDSFQVLLEDDIPETKFKHMLGVAVARKGLLQWIKALINRFKYDDEKSGLNWSRIALGSSLVIAAFLIWIISNKPLPVKEIDNGILDWSGSQITNKISELEGMIYAIQNEEAKNQELNKRSLDKWDASYQNIRRSLKEIKKDVKSESL